MPNIFIPHSNQTAEASLQRSFEQSVRQLERLTQRLIAWQSLPNTDDFPKPDLSQFGAPPDTLPDMAQAELQSRTVAATAAVLTAAYGEGGQYQAEGYTIQSEPQDGGKTAYRVADAHSRQAIFAFERDDDGVLNVTKNQLTVEQAQDFLQVAQRITQMGFELLEADITGQTQSQVLGNLAPVRPTPARSVERPSLNPKQAQSNTPVTPLDLVQWRYAAIVLGRGQGQVGQITAIAQAAAQVQGQSFLRLYEQSRLQPLPLQLNSRDILQMRQDIHRLKDLVWQIGPARVEQLFQTQRRLDLPVHILRNDQVAASPEPQSPLTALER